MSVDAKVVNGVVCFCVLLGLALVVAGGVVHSQIREGSHECVCHESECCRKVIALCDECFCHDYGAGGDDVEGKCKDYDTGESGAGAIALAIAGVVVCTISAIMLITMRWCKEWSEKHLHVRYPAVSPMAYRTEIL